MAGGERTREEWAQLLKGNWERLASSEYRDFFVASHAGWDDPDCWERTAREDLERMLAGFDGDALAAAHVLEIGCGVGRLARLLAPRAASYTGLDIAPSMLAEARARCADLASARFLESGGLGAPAEARDRRYDLVLAASVMIHCPRPVIEALVADAWSLLAPAGRMRLHFLADPHDAGGFTPEQYEESKRAILAEMARTSDATRPPQLDLLPKEHYMGASFGHAELRDLLGGLTGGAVEVERLSIGHHAAWVGRPVG